MPLRRLAIPLALAISLLFAASAHAFVYWGDPHAGTIGRANLDGSAATDDFIATGGEPFAVAVNASHIYWANHQGTIGRANLDGTNVEPNFISGLGQPTGIALTPSLIFWSDAGTGKIGRANLDGSARQPSLIAAEASPCGVAVDSGSVYWTHMVGFEAFIGRAPFGGTSPQSEFVKVGINITCGVAVNSANIFWTDIGLTSHGKTIGRANASDGGAVNPSLIGEADGPCGIALAGTQMYWANAGDGMIGRANTDGTGVDEELVHTGGGEICGVAVDSLFSPPITPPPPTDGGPSSPPPSAPAGPPTPGTIRLLKLKPAIRTGASQLTVEVDEAGKVTLAGKGVAPAKATAAGAGPLTLAVRAAKGNLSTLKRTGRLATKVTVTFKPSNGGASAALTKALTLRRKFSPSS